MPGKWDCTKIREPVLGLSLKKAGSWKACVMPWTLVFSSALCLPCHAAAAGAAAAATAGEALCKSVLLLSPLVDMLDKANA